MKKRLWTGGAVKVNAMCQLDVMTQLVQCPPAVHPPLKGQADEGQVGKRGGGRGSNGERI